jgi:hypothetical protein
MKENEKTQAPDNLSRERDNIKTLYATTAVHKKVLYAATEERMTIKKFVEKLMQIWECRQRGELWCPGCGKKMKKTWIDLGEGADGVATGVCGWLCECEKNDKGGKDGE